MSQQEEIKTQEARATEQAAQELGVSASQISLPDVPRVASLPDKSDAPENLKPVMSFDFDGVICRPPLGFNVALGRELDLAPLKPDAVVKTYDGTAQSLSLRARFKLQGLIESVKYFGRSPLPFVDEGLRAIVEHRTPIIVTGRSFLAKQIVEAWLLRYGFTKYFQGVYPNNTPLRTAQYKLYTLRARGISEHVDDDGSITYYLANNGIARLYLVDWPRNRGLPYPKSVTMVHHLEEIAAHLAKRPTPPTNKKA